MVRALEQLNQKNRQLTELSSRDPVSGLGTRRYVLEALEREIQRCRRHRTSVAVVMLDIDHFKRLNDSYGHVVGDEALRRVGAIIEQNLRAADVAGRYGGEEFLFVLGDASLEAAGILAERLRQAVEAERFETGDGRRFPITVSLGVADYQPGVTSAADIIRVADAALYRAKDAGRNRVKLASP